MKRKLEINNVTQLAAKITLSEDKNRMDLYKERQVVLRELVSSYSAKFTKLILSSHRLTQNPEIEMMELFNDFKQKEEKIRNPLNVLIIQQHNHILPNNEKKFMKNLYFYFPANSLPLINVHNTYKQEPAFQKNEMDYLKAHNGRLISESDVHKLPVDIIEIMYVNIYKHED